MKRFASTRDTVKGSVWEVWEVCDHQETGDFLHVRRVGQFFSHVPFLVQPERFQGYLQDVVQGLAVAQEAGPGAWQARAVAGELGKEEGIMRDRSLEVAGRVKGRDVCVDSWAVEKLWKVAEAIVQARDAGGEPELEEALMQAWRNLAKLGAWQAGNTAAYQEEAVQAAFAEGGAAMRRHLEELLAPILEGGHREGGVHSAEPGA